MSQKSGKKKTRRKYFQTSSGVSRHNLITFGIHDDSSLPSDDSDDSSYEPTNVGKEDVEKEEVGKKSKRGTPHYHTTQKRKRNLLEDISESLSSRWSVDIPNELLHKVFWHGVSSLGALPFLCRSAQVCQKWNLVASYPSLWTCLDFSFMAHFPGAKDDTLNLLRDKNLLRQVKQFKSSGWKKLTSCGVETLAENCPALMSLDLSGCERITARGLSLVAARCRNLTAINLSSVVTDATSNMSIKNLLEQLGRQLESLNLAGNIHVGSPTLNAVQTFCGNLKMLDLSDSSISNIHIERLQAGCPKLVELRLAQLSLIPSTPKRNEMEASGGFPDLELLSLASITGGDGTDDSMLQRLLKTSTKLRQIDLRGCEKITHNGLLSLPIVSLEQLFLSHCKISWKVLLSQIKLKWQHSLKDLDVSWGSNLHDAAFASFVSKATPNTVLISLNLAGTGVTAMGIRAIIETCSNLKTLNLTSCRGVPRGLKQLHESSIEKLRGQLHTEPDEIDLIQAE